MFYFQGLVVHSVPVTVFCVRISNVSGRQKGAKRKQWDMLIKKGKIMKSLPIKTYCLLCCLLAEMGISPEEAETSTLEKVRVSLVLSDYGL